MFSSSKLKTGKSVYPWDDFIEQITKKAEDGKLVVINESKADQMLARIGVQPSERSRIISLAKDSISQTQPSVNPSGKKNLYIRESLKALPSDDRENTNSNNNGAKSANKKAQNENKKGQNENKKQYSERKSTIALEKLFGLQDLDPYEFHL